MLGSLLLNHPETQSGVSRERRSRYWLPDIDRFDDTLQRLSQAVDPDRQPGVEDLAEKVNEIIDVHKKPSTYGGADYEYIGQDAVTGDASPVAVSARLGRDDLPPTYPAALPYVNRRRAMLLDMERTKAWEERRAELLARALFERQRRDEEELILIILAAEDD